MARLAEARRAPPVLFQGGFWQATHIALTPCKIRIWPLIPARPGCCPPQSKGALLPPKYSPCSCLDLNKAVDTADLLDTQKKTQTFTLRNQYYKKEPEWHLGEWKHGAALPRCPYKCRLHRTRSSTCLDRAVDTTQRVLKKCMIRMRCNGAPSLRRTQAPAVLSP